MRSVSTIKFGLAVTAALAFSVPAMAQEAASQSAYPVSLGQDGIDGTVLRGGLEAGASFTDNFFYTGDELEQTDGTGFLLKPELAAIRVLPRARMALEASGEFATFDVPDDIDDYFDSRVGVGADWVSSARNRWRFGSRLSFDHDPFGTERTESTPLETRELDEYREILGNLGYRYGLPTDQFNFDVNLATKNKTYTSNEAATQFLDHEDALGQLGAYYNLSAKTSLFASVSASRSLYEVVAPGALDRSATELRYGLGSNWKASAKTSGNIYLGYVNRRPRDDRRDDYSGFDWSAGMSWSPRSVSTFEIQTGRVTQESYLLAADFINNRYGSVSWSQQWGARFNSKLAVRYIDSEFVGIDRNDDTLGVVLDAEYLLSRYLKLLGTASSIGRDTDDAAISDYDRFYGYIGIRYAR